MEKTMNGASCSQGDIVLVPYPFTDLLRTKVRPALVVSHDRHHKGNDRVLAPLTSVARPDAMLLVDDDLEAGTLHRVSYVLPHKLFTIEEHIIQHRIGKLTPQALAQVLTLVHETF
jgi:mRNA interferase MazF